MTKETYTGLSEPPWKLRKYGQNSDFRHKEKGTSKKGKGTKSKPKTPSAPEPAPPDALGLAVLLLEAGADPRLADDCGQTPPKFAREATAHSQRSHPNLSTSRSCGSGSGM